MASSRGRASTAGKNIQKMRVLRDMKQVDLAEVLGTDRSAVANWETGRYLPSEEMVIKMQNLFHADKSVILGRKPLRFELANVKWASSKPSKSGQYLVFAKVGEEQTKYLLLDYDRAEDRWEEKQATYIHSGTGRQIDSYTRFAGEVLQWTAFPKSDMDI